MFLFRRMNWRQVLPNFRWDRPGLTYPVRMHATDLGSQVFKDLGVLCKVPLPSFLNPLFFCPPPRCLVSGVCLKRVIAPRFKIYSSSYSKSFVIKV